MADTPQQRTHQPTQHPARAVLFIASTYVYFLIFAQFGFLKRLGELHLAQGSLTPVMAAMALGGIAASLFGQRLLHSWTPRTRLRAGFLACAATTVASLLALNPWSAGFLAAAIGLSLGLLTVTLVTHLRGWAISAHPFFTVGLGTGFGYFLCNLPWLFAGTTVRTALLSGAACALAAFFVNDPVPFQAQQKNFQKPLATPPFPSVLLGFFALIWLDSAAFYIIQNSPALKASTWQGTLHLWSNGVIHLLAALASAWLLQRRGLFPVMLAAFAFIGGACLLLHDPSQTPLASVFYPAGVSLYSVGLVACPSLLLASRSSEDRERQAGLIYAIAGWGGSAMGIGMGQHLHRVPTLFVAAAGLALLSSAGSRFILRNKAPAAAALGLALLAGLLERTLLHPPTAAPLQADTPAARGRQVYIAEGCIHCHSQYVRPHHPDDVTMWGPGSEVEVVRHQTPPLIGNRRQGPDLSEVGGRRSPLWLRMHFLNPRDVSYHSIMPSYNYLFADQRGDDLVAYMASLQEPRDAAHLHRMLASWTPASQLPAHFDNTPHAADGEHLFTAYCATCHLAGGRARTKWGFAFRQLPPDLFAAPLLQLGSSGATEARTVELERIMKFGIPGTDMPGHEYLPDADLSTLAHWVLQTRARNTR